MTPSRWTVLPRIHSGGNTSLLDSPPSTVSLLTPVDSPFSPPSSLPLPLFFFARLSRSDVGLPFAFILYVLVSGLGFSPSPEQPLPDDFALFLTIRRILLLRAAAQWSNSTLFALSSCPSCAAHSSPSRLLCGNCCPDCLSSPFPRAKEILGIRTT